MPILQTAVEEIIFAITDVMVSGQPCYLRHNQDTVRCRYNAVHFLQYPRIDSSRIWIRLRTHNRHPIARQLGRAMGCLLCVSSQIHVLQLSLLCSVWYRNRLDRVIPTLTIYILIYWCHSKDFFDIFTKADFVSCDDDVIKWNHFPRYWPFVRGIHRSPVVSSHKGQWRGDLMFSLICAWTSGCVNNRDASDLRRHRAHYHVSVMQWRPQIYTGPEFSLYLEMAE